MLPIQKLKNLGISKDAKVPYDSGIPNFGAITVQLSLTYNAT